MSSPQRRTVGSRVYALLFKVFGPAQLGDVNGPSNPLPVRDEACSLCGRPTAEHTVERTPQISRLRCPADAGR